MRRAVDWQTGPVCIGQPTGFFSTPCGPTTDPLPGSDALEVRRVVGDDGVVAWHVNASQSPLALRSGAWELTCETQDGQVLERRAVALARGETARVRLRCGEPPCAASRALRARVVMRVAGRVVATRRAALARGRRQRIVLPRVRGDRVGVEVRTVRGTRAARRRSALTVFAAGAYDGERP